jgi:hypothetical protein
MTRFVLFFATACALFITACIKEPVDAPENCIDGLVIGQYGSFLGSFQPAGGGDLQAVPDAQTNLKTVSVDCDRISFTILNTNSITFEANCTQSGNVISGTSDDGKGTFTLNTVSKKMAITYQDASGKYTITAVKES